MTEIKRFALEMGERFEMVQLETEHKELLVRYATASMDLDNIRAVLPQVRQRIREKVADLAKAHGVLNFLQAHVENGVLICKLPEIVPAAAQQPAHSTTKPEAVNGAPQPGGDHASTV